MHNCIIVSSPNKIYFLAKFENISNGTGNIMVLFFSAEMLFNVCRYLSWSAPGLAAIISLAALRAELAFCSPSAAITCNSTLSFPTFYIFKLGSCSWLPLPWLLWRPQLLQPWPSVTELVTSHLYCIRKNFNIQFQSRKRL